MKERGRRRGRKEGERGRKERGEEGKEKDIEGKEKRGGEERRGKRRMYGGEIGRVRGVDRI
jgi:hypothetical protein